MEGVTTISKLYATESNCPFGCELSDCWQVERGYCLHLVGFSNDGKTYEPLSVDKKGYPIVSATLRDPETKKVVKNRKKIEKGKHVLINPEFPQRDNGAVHMARRWSSYRVYMKVPEHTPELEEHLTAIAAGEADDS